MTGARTSAVVAHPGSPLPVDAASRIDGLLHRERDDVEHHQHRAAAPT